MADGERMATRRGGDWVGTLGTILVAVGVSMWIVYAVGRYVLGWQITDRGFLPYHLATILPGMVLRYHRFFFEDLPRWASTRKEAPPALGLAPVSRPSVARATTVVLERVHRASTAAWATSVVAVALLEREARVLDGAAGAAVHSVARTFFSLAVACVLGSVASWAMRRRVARGPAAGEAARLEEEILRVKVVSSAVAFIGGTYFAYLCAFREWLR